MSIRRQGPWGAIAIVLNMFQELLRLTLLSVVNLAVFLVVRKLFEAFCCSHSFQAVQIVISSSISGVLSKGVDVDLKIARIIILFLGRIVRVK